ncbi:MAG: response regulator transcription factor [Lachnospiraceae bacterium]|nr:response regulator transcription factor [Lachnospiraceae bacterium]
MKILLAEDTKDLSRAVTAVLKHEGYDVDQAFDGAEASGLLNRNGYDIVLLDVMMPEKDGLTVLSEMRDAGDLTPVLMLTAKAEIDDRVAGLDGGADDYLTKPFAMKELLARIRSLTRRQKSYEGEDLKYGDIVLSPSDFSISCMNSVRLSIKEYELMRTFILHSGKELDCSFLTEHVWEGDPDADKDTVFLYVSYLRGKLSSVGSETLISEKDGVYTFR